MGNWIKSVKYIKLFKIRVTTCYNINVTYLQCSKIRLLKSFRLESWHVFSLSCIYKKMGNVIEKNPGIFQHNIAYKISSFFSLPMTIITNILWKLFELGRKICKIHHYVSCYYNNTSIIHIIYGLDNITKTDTLSGTYKIPYFR